MLETTAQARLAASSFARFSRLLSDFDPSCLRIVIPDFHSPMLRWRQFETAFSKNAAGRKKDCPEETEWVLAARPLVVQWAERMSSLPLRVSHNDCKINNMLVHGGSGEPLAIIDLDTCMPGPLLTDFGFMEFAGTLARPVFRRVFRLPGRSAIDAVTSFVGAASIGLLITISQYNSGNYTTRQACAIATNFSVVAIPFALVVASVAGIGHLFVSWYGFVVLACLLAAIITPRLPPLSNKAKTYVSGLPDSGPNTDRLSKNLWNEAWERAVERAESSPGIRGYFAISLSNMMFFLFSVMSAAMALATLAALITFHTPVFTWLSYPFIAALEFARIPDAAAASPALFAGFLDQYIPAIVATGIDSQVTSFILAGLSVCQLIFMSEVGVIILRSSLPLSISDLVVIFLLRTAITLPVLIVGAHIVAG